jgi:N-methylhydantoinase B
MAGQRLDPITTEVIANALVSTADEILAALIKSAYSTNIKERQDCSSVVMDANGKVVCIGDISQPIHMSSFMFTGGAILQRFGAESLREGDVFMVNDPYSGGPSHLADVTFVGPVFHRGRFLGFVGNTGHWPDVGGKAPGQCALGDATEIYQEAIRFPPVRIHRAGELQREILEVVLLNVRDPDSREGDIRAQVGSVQLGVRRMQELADRHGADVLLLAMEEVHRASEAKVRHGLLQLSEGSFEAVDYMDDDLDSDEPIPMRVKVTVRHRPEPTISLDFTGTGGPARWGINSPYSATAAMVGMVLRSVLDPTALGNDGFWRPIQMTVPKGCLLNAQPPSPVGARSEVCAILPDLLLAALAPAVKEKVLAGAHGVHGMGFSSQRPPNFIYYETVAGGGGARETKDGIDGIWDASNLPIEAMELEFPMMADRLEYVPDSAGPGRFRGGVGVRKEYRMLVDSYVATHSNRHTIPAPGLMGAGNGTGTRIVHRPDTDASQELPREGAFIPIKAQDVVTIVSGGGGGFGNALERDPQLVLRDVRNGKVTREGARRDYGVVVDGDALRVDVEATALLRREMRRRRAPPPR